MSAGSAANTWSVSSGEGNATGRFDVEAFAHASRLLVHPREHVHAEQVIALSGSTGVSTAPHLHFEIRRNGQVLDPRRFVVHR